MERAIDPARAPRSRRADWLNARAAAVAREAAKSELAEARAVIRKFHHQLYATRGLDPACGSGNFLYVTLEHLKRQRLYAGPARRLAGGA